MSLDDIILRRALFLHRLVFFPTSEFIAPAPAPSRFLSNPVEVSALVPSLAIVPNMLPPVCVLRFLLFCGHICLAHLTVTFRGKFHLLTLSYLATKDCPFGNRTLSGVTRLLIIVFCLRILTATSSSTTHYIFQYRFAISPISGAAAEPSRPAIGKNPPFFPFCFYVYRLCTKHRFLPTVFFSF